MLMQLLNESCWEQKMEEMKAAFSSLSKAETQFWLGLGAVF